jgi:hypothetical protein
MKGPKQRWSDSIIRPVKKTLLGDEDYKGSDLKPEDVVVAPIGDVMQDLCALPWDAWCDYAFAREPMNGKLDDAKRHELMGRARECGSEWAQRCVEQFSTRSPIKIAEKLGATVQFDKVPQGQDRVLFAEYVEPSSIFIYDDALDKVRELTADEKVRQALGEDVRPRAVLIAHEVYHLLEFQHKKEMWTQTYKEEIHVGPITHHSSLIILSEIASMGFASELIGMSYNPYVFDILMTWAYSPAAGMTLYDEVMGYQPRVGREEKNIAGALDNETQGPAENTKEN